MKKQATQIIAGDSVRVADINLKGGPRYLKVRRVCRGGLTVTIEMSGGYWGTVATTASVRVHPCSHRDANVTYSKE